MTTASATAAIAFDIVPSALGRMLVAGGADGVRAIFLADDDAALESELRERFPRAELVRDPDAVRAWAREAERRASGAGAESAVPLAGSGTAFQLRVWDALTRIPRGQTRTYAQVAEEIGSPSAVRAVASACARNPIALLVPCHRVVRSDGSLAGYRWGVERKRALLAAESA